MTRLPVRRTGGVGDGQVARQWLDAAGNGGR
jgi:hypothetical protein